MTEELKIRNFLDGLADTNYKSNKLHAVKNMMFYLEKYQLELILQENKIKKKNYKDIADSIMQSIAYYYYKL
jgi:hypothetical protein